MKQNAKSDKPFTLNSHVLERVKAWENLVSEGKLTSIVSLFKGTLLTDSRKDEQIGNLSEARAQGREEEPVSSLGEAHAGKEEGSLIKKLCKNCNHLLIP